MDTTNIREKLHQFIDKMEDKKAAAIYTLFEAEIEMEEWEYTEELKSELDKRYEYYQNGGTIISAADADEQIRTILQSGAQQ